MHGKAIVFCIDCCENLCELCSSDHKRARKTVDHRLLDVRGLQAEGNGIEEVDFGESLFARNTREKPLLCDSHRDEKLKFYCETCSVLVCRDCIAVDHSKHTYNHIDKVTGKVKHKLESSLEKIQEVQKKIQHFVENGAKVIESYQTNKECVRGEICTAFDAIQFELSNRKETLLSQSLQIVNDKVSSLVTRYDHLDKLKQELGRVCELISTATTTYSPEEMLSFKRPVSERLCTLLSEADEFPANPFEREHIAPIYTSLDISFVQSAIAKFGLVSSGCCPHECTLALATPRAVSGKERKLQVTVRDVTGKKYQTGGDEINGSVRCGSVTLPLTVADNRSGTYTLSFTPVKSQQHELSITLQNVPIKNSPFSIRVRQPRDYQSLSTYEKCFSTHSAPWCVSVSDSGDVFVAEGGRQGYITVFDSAGYSLQTIGATNSTGKCFPKLHSPSGLVVTDDNLYISEFFNNQVLQLSRTGEFKSKFGSKGSEDGQMNGPRGMLLDRDQGKMYISDSGNDRISVFNVEDNSFSHHIGGSDSNGSNLENPWGIAFDPLGNLHIACYNSHCIKVYTTDGEYLYQYGKRVITCPAGIAVDEEGYSFVAEYGGVAYRLLVFSPQHKLVHAIQNFSSPAGIAQDKDGHVFVADHGNNRVLKY